VICNMPICLGGRPDRMVWAGTKNGAFTMRSAYHLAQSMEADGEGGFMFIGGDQQGILEENMRVEGA
jgi:hypothetical protein